MSNTDSSDDIAVAESTPAAVIGGYDAHSFERALATYRYENALLKTELAAALERHDREVAEIKLKFESQLKESEESQLEIGRRLKELEDTYADEQRKLQLNNLHLQQKIKVLSEDLEARTQERDQLTAEKAQVVDNLHRHKLLQQSQLQALKTEKEQLRETADKLQGELDKERTTVRELTTTITSEKHQQELIKSRVAEVEQQCRVQLSAAQSELSQLKLHKDQEAATTAAHIKELMGRLEEEKVAAARCKDRLSSKEAEFEKRLAENRQSQLSSSQQLLQQNSQLQDRIKSLEATLSGSNEKTDKRVHELEDKIKEVNEDLHKEEREKAVLEARVMTLENLEGVLKEEREASSKLRQDIQHHQAETQRLQQHDSNIQQHIAQLKSQLSEAKKQNEVIKEEGQNIRAASDRRLAEYRADHQEELDHLQARITALQSQLEEKNKQYLEECSHLKQKVRTYGKLIRKLRHKIEMGVVQVEQLEAERAALQENVPAHVYHRLQQQLQNITRRHNEFAAFIRGLNEFQSSIPELGELTRFAEEVGKKVTELDEEQLHCLSELESL